MLERHRRFQTSVPAGLGRIRVAPWATAAGVVLAVLVAAPAEATFPASGNGKLAFERNAQTTPTVWSMAHFGSNPTDLGTGVQPAWSPNGTQIALILSATTALQTMSAAGGTRTTIVSSGAAYPAWSPDALSIAYVCGGDICSVVVATGTSTNLTNSAQLESQPDWSPDGTKIAFHRWDDFGGQGTRSHVFVMDANGSNPIDRTPIPGTNFADPSFKPNGLSIALETDAFGNTEIGVIPATGISVLGDVQRVTNHAAFDGSPVWSPDGTMLAFESVRDGNWEIYTINAILTGLNNRTNDPVNADTAPNWQTSNNTVTLSLPAGTNTMAFVGQLGLNWSLGDFLCNQVGGDTLSVVQPTTGVRRNFQYNVNSGGQTAQPFSYGLRLQPIPNGTRGPEGFTPFGAFATVDDQPEVQLNDGANPFVTNGGDSIDTDVSTQLPDGLPCSNGSECISGFCVDGLCCDGACGGLCNACNRSGFEGACGPIAAGSDPANECAGSSVCNGSGSCTLEDGQSCSSGSQCTSGNCADGLCCSTTCSGTCARCDATPGTCTFISAGTDPFNECSGSSVCTGSGGCTLSNGQSCSSGSQCTSGNCRDGVCCNSSCTGTCRRCDVAGSVGSCSLAPEGTDPDNECPTFCLNGGCAVYVPTTPVYTTGTVPALDTRTTIAAVLGLVFLGAVLILLRR